MTQYAVVNAGSAPSLTCMLGINTSKRQQFAFSNSNIETDRPIFRHMGVQTEALLPSSYREVNVFTVLCLPRNIIYREHN